MCVYLNMLDTHINNDLQYTAPYLSFGTLPVCLCSKIAAIYLQDGQFSTCQHYHCYHANNLTS